MANAKHASPVATAIVGQKHASGNLKLAELVGSYLESGQQAIDPGDYANGHATSFGAFQIHLPAHPGVTEAQADNPTWAVAYMRGAYQAAVNKVGAAAFKANPEHAAEQAAYLAERPSADYYTSRGSSTVNTAYTTATHELGAKTPAGHVPAPLIAAPSTVTVAGKSAARRLYAAGFNAENAAFVLAELGASTKGKYTPSVLTSWLNAYKKTGAIPGSTNPTSQAWRAYIGQAQATIRGIGKTPPKAVTDPFTPPATNGSPSQVNNSEGGVETGLGLPNPLGWTEDLAKLISWFFDPDHLIRVGFIILGFILVIIGLAKLSGATVPKVGP